MTETKERFRDHLAQILDAKFAEAFRTPEERASWDMVRPEWKQAMSDMAEAVYAQALRDVLSMKQSGDWDDVEIVYVHDIESYAGYHGIDLED